MHLYIYSYSDIFITFLLFISIINELTTITIAEYCLYFLSRTQNDTRSTLAPQSVKFKFITIVIRSRSRRLDKLKLLTGYALHSLFELNSNR